MKEFRNVRQIVEQSDHVRVKEQEVKQEKIREDLNKKQQPRDKSAPLRQGGKNFLQPAQVILSPKISATFAKVESQNPYANLNVPGALNQ